MAYRDESVDVLEAPTSEGMLRVELGARATKLSVANRTLHIVDNIATIIEHKKPPRRGTPGKDKRTSIAITGRLTTARDVLHEDLGVWLELPGGMRRIFGVEPVSLLEPEGLPALASLDRLAHRLRAAIGELAGDIRRAVEIGRGLDKVLLADHGDRYVVYTRALFRDRARFAMTIYEDGRIVLADGKPKNREIIVRSRFLVTAVDDYVRFADTDGSVLASVAIPWITWHDRDELARRIGQLVDREPAEP